MSASGAVTAQDVELLHSVVAAAQASEPVRWRREDDIDVRTGTVRRISYPARSNDLWSAELQITTSSGTEIDLPITQAVALLGSGAMVFGR